MIHLPSGKYHKRADGIIHIILPKPHRHNIPQHDINEFIATIAELTEGQPAPLLIDLRRHKPKEVIKNQVYGAPEILKLASAIAVILDQDIKTTIYNFFLKMSNTPVPFQLFIDWNDSIFWLLDLSKSPASKK